MGLPCFTLRRLRTAAIVALGFTAHVIILTAYMVNIAPHMEKSYADMVLAR